MKRRHCPPAQSAFTLIELLVVIAIIVTLTVERAARAKGKR
jgi:prepilin-type N-terminal cleavage/methylation domain-containing protein